MKEIDLDGIVYVQHIPILDLRLPWLKTPRTELLPMTLAYVDLTPNCKKWLEQNLLDTHIWFKVLRREKDKDQLQAALFHQKVFKIKYGLIASQSVMHQSQVDFYDCLKSELVNKLI